MRKSLRAVVGLCVAGVAMFGMASAAGAQIPGYEPEPTLEFDYPTQVEAGGEIAITGNCTEGGTVSFTIGDEEIGSVDSDANGDFEATFDVPNLTPGNYTIEGTCAGLVASGDIEVLAAGQTPNGGTNNSGSTPLARTGFNPLPVVTLGAAALVLGGAAVYGSKRRRTA